MQLSQDHPCAHQAEDGQPGVMSADLISSPSWLNQAAIERPEGYQQADDDDEKDGRV